MLRLEEPLPSSEEGMPPFQPSQVEDLACILHKRRKERNLAHALRLHAYMRESGLEAHPSIGNCLVSMLVEAGSMCHAQQVFDRLLYRDECPWNSLITGYVKNGESQHALTLYQKMQEDDSLHPSGYSFVALLKACTVLKDLERGREIHAAIARLGLLEKDVFVGSTLVNMYAKCGCLAKAQEVFHTLLVRNVVLWNALITGYVEHGYGEEALNCFEQMQHEGISPDVVTLVCSLKACGTVGATVKGQEIHAEIARTGLLERDVFVGSTLLDMYLKCGCLAKAQEVFDKVPVRDVVLWNTLIAGYVEQGCGQEALNCFEQMQHEGISPDAVTLVCSLKACGRIGAMGKGQEIHAEIAEKGFLERDAFVGSVLVDMYAKCGSLSTAQEVFDKLLIRDLVSWNALIAGYAEQGRGEVAIDCFEQMQHSGISQDAVTFVCILKACGSIAATDKGREIHVEITRKGLERNLLVGNSLIDVYTKCCLLAEAQKTFDKLPIRNAVSWNALIVGYTNHGHSEEALVCFKQMQLDGIFPDVVTLVCSLKACGSLRDTIKGQEIHAEITRKGFLERDELVGSTLVDMYAKCGLLAEAQKVFDKLPAQDMVSWTALIAGYAEHGCGEEALNCFEQMQHQGISPGAVTFVCSLKACGNIRVADKGQKVHAESARKGFLERDIFIGSSLVDMYAKCGLLAEAQEVFDKLPVQDVVSWTALIAGYVEHGRGEEVLNCLEQMQLEGVFPSAVTYAYSLKACGIIGAADKVQEIHGDIARQGMERELVICNTLVNMYAKCGSLAKAKEVFDKLPVQDATSWTVLIAGQAEFGSGEEALNYFEQMQHEGLSLSALTFVYSLKACSSIRDTVKGREIHAEIARKGLERDLLVGNTLVDMYAKCGLLVEARELFDKLPGRDVVSWTVLISGYAEHGHDHEALNCFEQMQHKGVSLVLVTFVCCLKACGSIGATLKGQEIHAELARKGLERDLLIGSTLVDMYAKCGLLAEAQEVFDKLAVQIVVSWNALITGYVDHGFGEEALKRFEQMQHEGFCPDAGTLVCGLKACGSIGATIKGRETHVEIARRGLEKELLVGNTLVDMYAKCGLPVEAQDVFDKLSIRDVVSLTALITGYAQLGKSENVFYSFERMLGEGMKPNLITFTSVLNACCHAGLVDKGQMYFEAISNDYGLIPTLEHYTSMADLLGRAGHVEKALAIIKKMPFHPGIVMWHIVLGACQKLGNVELGRYAFEHAVQLDEKDITAYVCMSNIYADVAMQEDLTSLRQ